MWGMKLMTGRADTLKVEGTKITTCCTPDQQKTCEEKKLTISIENN